MRATNQNSKRHGQPYYMIRGCETNSQNVEPSEQFAITIAWPATFSNHEILIDTETI